MGTVLLNIKDLKTYFYTDYGILKAVDGVNLRIEQGETLSIVGESGSGKTVTALSIINLVPFPGRIIEGEILFNKENLRRKTEEEMRLIRGNRISMIFQDPMTSLNPVLTIGDQLAEVLKTHGRMKKSNIQKKIISQLTNVGITDAAIRLNDFPHRLSGGMRQRVMIAMALLCGPDLLIADEPTTNLDVTIQAQVLELMKQLKEEGSSSILLITHDMGVVAEMSDKVAVMYAGKMVEYSDAETIFMTPTHPYTEALLKSVPRLDLAQKRLSAIPGVVPHSVNLPKGCHFHPRCSYARNKCKEQEPQLVEVGKGHLVSCLLVGDRND